MTDEIAAWGRRIHGPTLPGTGKRCSRDSALTQSEIEEVVSIVATARSGRHGATLPDRLKTRHWESTMTAMLAINARLGWPSAGWKIGAASLEVQQAEGMPGPSPGQLARDGVLASPGRVPARLFINYRCAESEFAFRMARDLPPRPDQYFEDEVADAVAALHPALEVGDTVFDDWYGASGYFGAALDNNGAAAFVYGAPVTAWRDFDLATARIDLSLNGTWQKSGFGAAAMGHPLIALTWIANWLRSRGLGLRAGEFVSTGSCTGHFFVAPGDRLVADFGALGVVDATFDELEVVRVNTMYRPASRSGDLSGNETLMHEPVDQGVGRAGVWDALDRIGSGLFRAIVRDGFTRAGRRDLNANHSVLNTRRPIRTGIMDGFTRLFTG